MRYPDIVFLNEMKMSEKMFIVCLWVIGLAGVVYGMSKGNHLVFLLGLVAVISGYLLIRKNLKASLRKRQE